MMRVFVFEFPGVYLGGAAVVVADDLYKAKKMVATDKRLSAKANFTKIKLVQSFPVTVVETVFFDDGDY